MAGAGLALGDTYGFVARGIFSFFIGGLCFHLYAWVMRSDRRDATAFPIFVALSATLWIFYAVVVALSVWSPETIASAIRSASLLRYAGFVGRVVAKGTMVALIPSTILTLALLEHRWRYSKQLFRNTGDLTYAIYLLHFPLQIVFALVILSFMSVQVFYSPWVFIVFMAVLFALARLCYVYFEMPARRWLRSLYRSGEGPAVARAEAPS